LDPSSPLLRRGGEELGSTAAAQEATSFLHHCRICAAFLPLCFGTRSSANHVVERLDGVVASWDCRSLPRPHREAISTGSSTLASVRGGGGLTEVRHHGGSTRGGGGGFKRLIILELGENRGGGSVLCGSREERKRARMGMGFPVMAEAVEAPCASLTRCGSFPDLRRRGSQPSQIHVKTGCRFPRVESPKRPTEQIQGSKARGPRTEGKG
jgi:hypothetical protein